jgi:hypothetical protein
MLLGIGQSGKPRNKEPRSVPRAGAGTRKKEKALDRGGWVWYYYE